MNNITVIAAVIADTPCHFPPLFKVSHEWKLPYISKLNLRVTLQQNTSSNSVNIFGSHINI